MINNLLSEEEKNNYLDRCFFAAYQEQNVDLLEKYISMGVQFDYIPRGYTCNLTYNLIANEKFYQEEKDAYNQYVLDILRYGLEENAQSVKESMYQSQKIHGDFFDENQVITVLSYLKNKNIPLYHKILNEILQWWIVPVEK